MAILPPKTVKAPAAATKKKADDDSWSDNQTLEAFVVCIHGPMGAGKTFLAASASEEFPAMLPAKVMTGLSDIYWGAADRGATDGFKHNNLRVPLFSFTRFMGEREQWEAAGLRAAPTIVQTCDHFVRTVGERVQAGRTKTVVVDTMTTLDSHLFAYHSKKFEGHPNHYEAYKHNLAAHLIFHTRLCQTGANILYLFHTRATSDETMSEKAKNASVLVAGGARFVPDLTGQAPKFYKHDASLQLVMMASKVPGKKQLERKVLVGLNDKGYEGKNRFEGILSEVEEPHLGKIFAKIRKGG
jgi:hypothetical protein